MNGYGRAAQGHWAQWLPVRYSTIKKPDEFFEMLGAEIEAEVRTQYQARLAGTPADLSGPEREGWANMARLMAENQVLAEMAYLFPEAGADSEDWRTDPTEPANILWDITRRHHQAQQDAYLEEQLEEDLEMDRLYQQRQAAMN